MRWQVSYKRVFSDKLPIEVWPKLVAVLKAAEEEMLNAPRRHGSHGERLLRTWRGFVGLLFVSKSIGTFEYRESDILGIEVGAASSPIIRECWEFLQARRGGTVRPTLGFTRRVCAEFAKLHALTGVETVCCDSLGDGFARGRPKVGAKPSAAFIDQVDALLPAQPWPQGTHMKIAGILVCPGQKVASAIRYLIDAGRRYEQVDGIVFDEEGHRVSPT